MDFDDLPEQDVTVHCIVSKLSIKDCFVLRAVSKRFKKIVETYFESMKYVNLSNYRNFNIQAFQVSSESLYIYNRVHDPLKMILT